MSLKIHLVSLTTIFVRRSILKYNDVTELEFLPDVLNDLDVDFSANPAAAQEYMNDQRNKRKVKEHTQKLQLNIINPLRENKRLLVLDLDYSMHSCDLMAECLAYRSPSGNIAILDTKPLTSGALPPNECARPMLHEFLESTLR